MSFRDVEELLAGRGITVSYESIRQWCNRFGPEYARALKKRRGRLGDIWYLDEVFIKINGELHYLWRAVNQDGDTIDILAQKRRNKTAAKRFIRKLLKGECQPAMAIDYRQTEELFGSAPGRVAFDSTQHRTV